jgi:hypothetical protein
MATFVKIWPYTVGRFSILFAPLSVGFSAAAWAWLHLVARRFGLIRHTVEATAQTAEHDFSTYWLLPLSGLIVTLALVALNIADIVGWLASEYSFERTQQLVVLSIRWMPWVAPVAAAFVSTIELASLRYLSHTAFSFTSDPLLNAPAERKWKLRSRSYLFFGGAYIGVMANGQPMLLRNYLPLGMLVLVLGVLCMMAHFAGVMLSLQELSPMATVQQPVS